MENYYARFDVLVQPSMFAHMMLYQTFNEIAHSTKQPLIWALTGENLSSGFPTK